MGRIRGELGMKITRRNFLLGSSLLALCTGIGKFGWLKEDAPVTGRIVGASSAIGHRLRAGQFATPSATIRKKIVIIGGGIAGLSAAWKLHKSGFHDFILLEMEHSVGGNSSYGENSVSAYPWGAHYVPLLAQESTCAHALFKELGIITGYENNLPVYNEYYLSAEPHERLFMYGRWQEGIVPQTGISDRDRAQYDEFFATMEKFKTLKGNDGRKVFAIPLDKSSQDMQYRNLMR